jgi:hypothetical protein
MCRYCNRNCFNRNEDFQHYLVWTAEMLMTPEMHTPPRLITIDDSLKTKD